MDKLINRIPGLHLLISSLPVSALRTLVESLASLVMSTSVLKALPGKLDIKRHSPSILYIAKLPSRQLFNILADFVTEQIGLNLLGRNPNNRFSHVKAQVIDVH